MKKIPLLLIFVFLMKEPFQIYLLFGNVYKVLYGMALIFTIFFVRKIKRSEMLAPYIIFISLMVLALFSSIIFGNYNVNLLQTIQFFVSLHLFFILCMLIGLVNNHSKLLSLINSVAVTMSLFSVILILLLLFDWNFFTIIEFYPSNGKEGMLFMIPFGFMHNPFDFGLTGYRSYGYASEPAKLAFFLVPFVLYNYHLFSTTRLKKYLVYFFLLIIAVISTRSTAAYASLLIGAFFYCWLLSKLNLKFLLFVLAASIVCLFFLPESFFRVNFLSYVNRIYEFTFGIQNILENPLGIGLGNVYEDKFVFDEEINDVRTYSSVTNILVFFQYLGFFVFIPLVFYAGFVLVVIKKLIKENTDFSYILAAMLFISSVFFISINMILSPLYVFYLALSVCYLADRRVQCRDAL